MRAVRKAEHTAVCAHAKGGHCGLTARSAPCVTSGVLTAAGPAVLEASRHVGYQPTAAEPADAWALEAASPCSGKRCHTGTTCYWRRGPLLTRQCKHPPRVV